LISATPATGPSGTTSSFPINNPTQVVGFVQQGLAFKLYAWGDLTSTSVPTISQCSSYRVSYAGANYPRNLMTAAFTENFATSFKTRTALPTAVAWPGTEVSAGPYAQNVPGLIYNSESGFYNPNLPAPYNVAGLADFGTRLRLTFSSIPNGVTIFVTTTNLMFSASTNKVIDPTTALGAPTANTAARLVGTESGFFFPVSAANSVNLTFGAAGTFAYSQVQLASGSGTAVYEVMGANPLTSDTYYVGILAYAVASPNTNSPAPGNGNVAGSFAPAPPAFSASDGGKAQTAAFPIPRFADTGSAAKVVGVTICRSLLLFPFVTNQNGFDTGLAIANTTQDPWSGIASQSGTCDLSFYGANAPSVYTTPALAGGTVWADVASTRAPNFQGYVFVICNFQYAHGFAFVSDIGARNIAMGYLALVLPDGGRTNTTSGNSLANGSGELLGQ